MSVNSGLKLVGNLFAVGLYSFKVIADYKKHGTHEAHNQLCDCMGYCTTCIWTEATAKAKAKTKSGR